MWFQFEMVAESLRFERHFPQITDHTALSRNPHERYRVIARLVRDPSFEKAPKRAKQVRAGP